MRFIVWYVVAGRYVRVDPRVGERPIDTLARVPADAPCGVVYAGERAPF